MIEGGRQLERMELDGFGSIFLNKIKLNTPFPKPAQTVFSELKYFTRTLKKQKQKPQYYDFPSYGKFISLNVGKLKTQLN